MNQSSNQSSPPAPNSTSVNLESQITAVTVYTDRALITRRGKVTLSGIETEIVLAQLPLTLQVDSVRVQGSGTVAVQLLGVRTEQVFATEATQERLADLMAQIQTLEDQKTRSQNEIAALKMQQEFVAGLSQQSVSRFARGLAQQQTNLSQTSELMTFLGQRHSQLAEAIAQQNQQLRDLEKQIQALNQQLYPVPYPAESSYTLWVNITAEGAGEFDLEVTYVCDRASWQPLYDLRLDSSSNRLQLSYLAEIEQTTGEDWHDVALTLSTAKPGLGTLPPKLDPWYLDVFRPMPAPAPMAAMMSRSRKEASFQNDEPYPGLEDVIPEVSATFMMMEETQISAKTAIAQISREGGVVTFQAGGNNDIPSDGNFHKVTLFNDEYPVRLEHAAVPKLVSFAYLQAVVSNPQTGVTLLPGEANVFRDAMFVGTSPLANVAPGQEFRLSLGIDESLKIERDLVEREVDKKLIGGQRRITYGYRIRVENLSSAAIALKLTEQLPVSRNEQIKVRLTRSTPNLQPTDLGVLEWPLVLPPQAKQEITYQFVVEHPPALTVTGLV